MARATDRTTSSVHSRHCLLADCHVRLMTAAECPVTERMPIVPATRVLRKNLGGPSSRIPPARSVHRDTGAKRHACFALPTYLRGLSPAPTGETEAVGSVMIARSQPKHNHAVSHPHIRRQASSSRHYVGGHALVPRPSSQVSLPVAVTVTTTPSGSGGIELEHMEHAVDSSGCATNVPQGDCSGSVPPDHDGGPKPLMTYANPVGSRRV